MTDVELYGNDTGSYDQIQNSRPDYSEAVKHVVEYAKKYIHQDSIVADFCSGTGSITKKIADEIGGLQKAILIDTNENFLEIARGSGIQAEKLETKSGDILEVKLNQEADAVLSIFAYHHVPDKDKHLFIKQIKTILKPEGVLILGEIYSPNKETTITYYNNLYHAVPQELQTPKLKRFLEETARSEEFEFKVEKSYADKEFTDNDFSLLESCKVFPDDSSGVGTFIEVWKIKPLNLI